MPNKSFTTASKKRYAALALKWCRENFGVNERKRRKVYFELVPKLKKSGSFIVFGHYCFWRNKIIIYEESCKTIYDVVSTMIHEYTHYLQSRTKYQKYEETHYYSQNPLEREAKRNEECYTKLCIKEIKSGYVK